MASAPNNLPLFYNNLQPLSSTVHADYRTRPMDTVPFLAHNHAIPITVDEFVVAQRNYPIVFSVGDNAVPLALMGLNEGVNVFVGEDGNFIGDVYVPAYVRRYPFMLARLQPESQDLSLCFDPDCNLVGQFDDGNALFENGQTTEHTKNILKFCEEFELSAQRTNAFVKELEEGGLLIDGEVSVQPTGSDKPFIYRGFRMVAEDKLRELRGDQLRKMNQSGMLPLIFAHLFSLPTIREIFGKQTMQGHTPGISPEGVVLEGALN